MKGYFYTNLYEIENYRKGEPFEVWLEEQKESNHIPIRLDLDKYKIELSENPDFYCVTKINLGRKL